MLHPVEKQDYKLEFPKKWRIHNVFHVSLLEQDTTRKGWEFSVPGFEPGDDKKYEMEAIQDSAVYAKEADGDFPGLYYLVVGKSYLEEKSTWEPFLAIMHLRKMVNTLHKDQPEKPIATSAPLDSAPLMAKPTIQLPAKQKRGQPTRRATKRNKTC